MIVRHFNRSPRRGVVTVFVTICLVILLSIVALAIDGGTLLSERRHAQATADAAALAAAADLYANYWTNGGTDPCGSANTSALTTAADNGYNNDGITSVVTVNIPPTSGDYIGKAGYVEVIVQYNQQRNFSNLFSSGTIPVRARAVALGAPTASEVGILCLDSDDDGTLNTQSSGTTTVSGAPVVVDSNHPTAARGGGGGKLVAPEFDITGNYTTTGGATFSGTMNTGRRPMQDPLAYLPVPNTYTLPVQSRQQAQYTQGTTTLSPGIYTGGISASGTASLILQPGIYYLDGGGFAFSGQGSLTGNGVMIYNAPRGNTDSISVNGQGSVNLSAPSSGIYQGVTFFQDRSSSVTATIQGAGSKTNITGTFYFAGAQLNIQGNAGASNLGSQYISNSLNLSGTGDINLNWNSSTVARKRTIILVE
jgi:hypothetical protein